MIIIGVAGASGSGKSLLASKLSDKLGSDKVAVISEDSYYKNHASLSFEQRSLLNFDHPDAFEHTLLVEHLKSLKQGKSINVPSYDYTTHSRKNDADSFCTQITPDHKIIFLEGILVFHDKSVRDLLDIKIFVDTDLDLAFIRRLRRDVAQRGRSMESVLSQYEHTVRPMYYKFIEPSKKYADINVPRGGKNEIAIEMISAKTRDFLIGNTYS